MPYHRFNRVPDRRVAQVFQKDAQPVVGKVLLRKAYVQKPFQSENTTFYPRFNRNLPMVTLRHNEGQPDHGHVAMVESAMVPVSGDTLPEDVSQIQFFHHPDQKRNIINAFMRQSCWVVHSKDDTEWNLEITAHWSELVINFSEVSHDSRGW